MNEKQTELRNREALLEAARPLIKYLAENHHPHIKVIVDDSSAEMVTGLRMVKDPQFIKD